MVNASNFNEQVKDDFNRLISPENIYNEEDLALLESLIDLYPFCQPLHMARARAVSKFKKDKTRAALTDALTYAASANKVYTYVHSPSTFIKHSYNKTGNSSRQAGVQVTPDVETAQLNHAGEGAEPLQREDYAQDTSEPIVIVSGTPREDVVELPTEDDQLIETVIPEPEMPQLVEESTANTNNIEQPSDEREEEKEQVLVDSIASSDYFTFNQSQIDPRQTNEEELLNTSSEVHKYHDDTLPYSFLWWLHKTRSEYAHTYQPFKPSTSVGLKLSAGLNQQYMENIFHIQPELNTMAATPATTVEFELKRKEDKIIERFIKEEPQIKPAHADKLDTENKARKSSEDNLDLVSETLARIYADQMLFHKAIDTYKKLSLKFPDKKLYFASQIENLEKKIS